MLAMLVPLAISQVQLLLTARTSIRQRCVLAQRLNGKCSCRAGRVRLIDRADASANASYRCFAFADERNRFNLTLGARRLDLRFRGFARA